MRNRQCGLINFYNRNSPHILLILLILHCNLHSTQSCSAKLSDKLEVFGPTCEKTTVSEKEMKRRSEECENIEKKRKNANWTLGLADSIKNPDLVVKKSGNIVVINDKYPKAKYHFLVIPEDDIGSIFKLNASHVELLERFGNLFEELKAEHCDGRLRAGFHAVPSMQRLHMHVISSDMVSPCLKTKAHWNSFTTSFFIPYQMAENENGFSLATAFERTSCLLENELNDQLEMLEKISRCVKNHILKELKENGSITRISQEEQKTLLATPLKCNQCDFIAKNMPNLKEHLLKHL